MNAEKRDFILTESDLSEIAFRFRKALERRAALLDDKATWEPSDTLRDMGRHKADFLRELADVIREVEGGE